MSSNKKTDSLLQAAFKHQRHAMEMEPYAAYIHNEMGNLYMQQRSYDSAAYHFDYALVLSPAWAVPWSNKIRLILALNQVEKAKEAIRVADSLQPHLAYVNVNAGLVMEKDSNWLAAESYYLAAIAENNVHYLPYQRLGIVYINMGKYSLADSFLLEAKNRKETFVINEKVFDFGIELGGSPGGNTGQKVTDACSPLANENVPGWKPLARLAEALMKFEQPRQNKEDAEKLIKKVIAGSPGSPLAHHYLGKIFFMHKQWQWSETTLQKAIARYQSFDDFNRSIELQMNHLFKQTTVHAQESDETAIAARIDSSCIKALLLYFHYNIVEDHYMLANIYEKQGRFNEAIDQYKIIAVRENQELMDQAVYKGFKKIFVENEHSFENIEAQVYRYEIPVKMGGAIKAARLLEKEARYEEAEAVLLRQVLLNRKAGFRRQAEMDKKNWGPAGSTPFNYFWLKANYDLEAETYNFYQRMLALLPRDASWYQKAGMFLYKRLQLTYDQLSLSEQKTFYEYSKGYAYPFKGSVEGPTEGYDEEGKYFIEENKFTIQATGEEVYIAMRAYDPLKTSHYYLQQAVKFSGEMEPGTELVEAMANLDQWMGNSDAAIDGYRTLLELQPDSNRWRNTLIEILENNKRFPDAGIQLDSLYKRRALTQEQAIKLAYYKVLSKNGGDGIALLGEYMPVNAEEKNMAMAIYIQHFMQNGQLAKALLYYRDSLRAITKPSDDLTGEGMRKVVEFDNLFYTEARILAMKNQDRRTLASIKQLLDSGFAYQQVLMNDPVLARLRKTKKWKRLLEGYSFPGVPEEAESVPGNMNYSTVHYRIPGSDFNPYD
jgi:predicted Zn-dependent protease